MKLENFLGSCTVSLVYLGKLKRKQSLMVSQILPQTYTIVVDRDMMELLLFVAISVGCLSTFFV